MRLPGATETENMSMNVQEIENVLQIFDEIILSTDIDIVALSVANAREKLNGNLPSIVIKQLFVLTGEQIKSLQIEKEVLEAKIGLPQHIPINGFYDFKDFLAVLQVKMCRTYAWKTDCIKASETSPDCIAIKPEDFQKWIKSQLVPEWAYEQVSRLVFQKRANAPAKEWTNHEYDFLAETHNADASKKNGELAQTCSAKFGREITEASIKGSIDRLRKQDRVPHKRLKAA